MSERSRRKRKPRNTPVSNVHYVGYVEDEESVEAIMKKFEELERIQNEIASSPAPATPTEDNKENLGGGEEEIEEETNGTYSNKSPAPIGAPGQQPLTEEQLQEVFKRTSAFTVRSALMETHDEDLDAMELWQVEFHENNTDELFEEDDYVHVDDDFWDREFGEVPKPKRGRRGAGSTPRASSSGGGRRSGTDRESIIARYKIMQVQVQDRNGNYFMVKKRVSTIDPSLPTYVKIPGKPIPRSWAHSILRYTDKEPEHVASSYHEVEDILSLDLKEFGTSYNCVYMDPPLLLPGEEPKPGKIHIDELARLNVPEIVPLGFLFVWIEKEWLQRIVMIAESWGFKYVENFCWIKKNINNQIHKGEYRYFNKSKLSLLIFRKEGDIELRHQRNPDCVFDFIKPMLPGEITESKPAFMYDVIETMLPTAVYHPEKNPEAKGLLELWAKKGTRRNGWTTVLEKH
ncbi:hypothetical protein BDB00DRAFT_96075 [Zychaea mexicana]|uniref:uncharacterized protein n=1 Tax=Zychaea mexicana TaxID=64656 RepID=UPI0022FF4571|nr:uncharacterized protein BDB00DRAFT_96075 [Zychaea mexicana]KAI9484963.1 hypothetical protein BDB00DRAFT_96075 [Zychaea mexicana]